ncbi:MAG: AI-2E family transporter, partial [Gammaproteobacteria bacterium]|nr:AI-2E family transporter [Gammaproteobacteria bacterium]
MYEVMRGWVNRFLSDEEGVLLAALLIVSVIIIVTMGTVLAPLLTGIVLAYVMQGAIKTMERFQMPKGLAVSITFVIFMGFFLSLLFFVIPRVWRQLQSLFQNIPSMVERTRDLLGELPLNYPELVSEQQVTSWIELLNSESAELGQWLLSFSLSQLPLLVAVAVYIMLVPLLVFFILKDQRQILAWCSSYLPSEKPLLDRIGREMDEQMANYIRGKVVEIIIVGGASFVFFQLMGLEY